MQRLALSPAEQRNEVPWGVNPRRVRHNQMTASLVNGRFRWPACSLLGMRRAWGLPCRLLLTDCRWHRVCTTRIVHRFAGYCFYACPFGAPTNIAASNFWLPWQDGTSAILCRPGRGDNSRASSRIGRNRSPKQVAALRRDVLTRHCWPGDGTRYSSSNSRSVSCPVWLRRPVLGLGYTA